MARGRARINDDAAANRDARRRESNDKAVVLGKRNRVREMQLHPTGLARLELFVIEQTNAGRHLGRADEKINLRVMRQRFRRGGEIFEPRIEQRGRGNRPRQRDNFAAQEFVYAEAGKVDRHAIARCRAFEFLFVRLQAADAAALAARHDFHFLADGETAIHQRPGHDRAETRNRKNAVNRQARFTEIVFGRDHLEQPVEFAEQIVQTLPRFRRDGNDFGIREDRLGERLANVHRHHLDPFRVHQIRFGQRDEAAFDLE